jgi:DNA-binding transcriptional MerR regulator
MTASSPPRQDRFTMAELRREFGVTARTLRFYEDKGLLHPGREGQSRVFSYRDRARLGLILRGKRCGFSLADMREILDLYNLKDGQVTQLRVSLDKARQRIDAMERQKAEIASAIADLKRTRDVIEGMLREREREQRERPHGNR